LNQMDRRTIRPAILPRSWQPGFEDQLRIVGRLLDHVPGDAAKGNLDSALPTGVVLPGKSSNVDVDETPGRWPLRQRAEKVRKPIFTIVLYRHRAIEAKVVSLRPLLLNRLIGTPLAVLKPEVHTRGRSDQDDSEPKFGFHLRSPTFINVGRRASALTDLHTAPPAK